MSQDFSSARFFIGHLLFFALLLLVLTGILTLFYFSTELESFTGESLPFLSLSAQGGLFRWFCALLWIGIMFRSLAIASFFRTGKRDKGCALFWRFIAVVAGFMSCNAVCALLPALLGGMQKKTELDAAGSVHLTEAELIPIGAIFFVLLLAIILRSSVKQVGWFRRWSLFGVFGVVLVLFAGSVGFHYGIPTENTSVTAPSLKVEKPGESSSEEEDYDSTTDPKGDFRSVSYEKVSATDSSEKDADTDVALSESLEEEEANAVSTQNVPLNQLEDLFGMKNSVEDLLGISEPLETKLGMDQPIEEKIEKHGIRLNLNRSREIVRYGSFGLFLGFLFLAITLLGHSLRSDFEAKKRDARRKQLKEYQSQMKDFRRLQKENQKLHLLLMSQNTTASP